MSGTIVCQCGCGRIGSAMTTLGKPRRFIHGHCPPRTAEHNRKIGLALRARAVCKTPTKYCPRCHETLPREAFGKRRGSLSEYSNSYCGQCTLDYNADRARKHWAAHPGLAGHRAALNRVITLRRHYGITVDDYEWLFSAQAGVCKICRKAESKKGKSLSVDHCHVTGRIRGLLCDRCNRGIGLLRDDAQILRTAAGYLEAVCLAVPA